MINTTTSPGPSLFDDGQIGSGQLFNQSTALKNNTTTNLIDLLYDGFYIVFLLKNHYIPAHPASFREKILEMLNYFEHQARKLQFSSEDIQDAKYAYCALLDETIVTQQDTYFFDLQNFWILDPLQLSLFGSQLAGYRFFEQLEEIRQKDKERLAALEVYHYCLLLGFHGKYRLESIHTLNQFITQVGEQIDYLKGKKTPFSPFAALPDKIRHIIHRELPFVWILVFLLLFTVLSFAGLKYMLSSEGTKVLTQYQNVISVPTEQAYITIHLP
ncbi:MAG TPA: type IVB secretion system protein IcmH/DotU [Acinetobacter lwoffii]|uniref:Type IVB secretion system protein IcmH/DotU n=1 Tax=Acinetobacter lwoffii TaxID=28090 RepID=A0A9D2URJ1_ACILW|nr:type IVB secretion system protein IcmH/DotU [Acinetobacter lwoffii]